MNGLHPALVYHVVNTLGWPSLRPLQEQAIEPIASGKDALLIAPTAGGKTEAAFFPVVSRLLEEDWRALSVVYVCPIKALLNDLEHRLSRYAELVGRRVHLWHGDVGASARQRLLRDPPDVLLTTPESLEVILISPRGGARAFLRRVRTVVVDEVHAFAGDDRGWHLLALLSRISHLAGGRIQRIGLSATVGKPEALLRWLGGEGDRPGVIIDGAGSVPVETEVVLDHVGTPANAAVLLSRLHRGEKRLVFCDSRARVEQLGSRLRERGVRALVTHSSLSGAERRRAETEFSESQNCIMVATSALELGIDVGDLDRVIQIDSAPSVASFLQRLGRTGRRTGSVRNCLFAAMTAEKLVEAAGLVQLWTDGWVEPAAPPPLPAHVLVQQMMTLALQEGRYARADVPRHLGGWISKWSEGEADAQAVMAHAIDTGLLLEEEGVISLGPEGEDQFGRRHFLELCSVFTGEPLYSVYQGREELGKVHPLSFQRQDGEAPILLLAGRAWLVNRIDWDRHEAFVEPADLGGRSQWMGSGRPLSFAHCQKIRDVLVTGQVSARLTRRAQVALDGIREEFSWLKPGATWMVSDAAGRIRWWTFAGSAANHALRQLIRPVAAGPRGVDDLAIELDGAASIEDLREHLSTVDSGALSADILEVDEHALESLKFADCLPRALALRLLKQRCWDGEAVRHCLEQPIRRVILGEGDD